MGVNFLGGKCRRLCLYVCVFMYMNMCVTVTGYYVYVWWYYKNDVLYSILLCMCAHVACIHSHAMYILRVIVMLS